MPAIPVDDPIPEGCDLACQTKIIIDGGLAAEVFKTTCAGLYQFLERGGELRNGHRVLTQLIIAENEAFDFMRVALEEMGHQGPWPRALRAHTDSTGG